MKWSKPLASFLATWVNIGAGYVWGRYGVTDALIVYGAIVVGLLALLGALKLGEAKLEGKEVI